MKSVKILASLLFVMMVCTAATLEEKQKGIYIVGVSASFTDPHVYFTSVQFIDSVKVGKDKLLPLRAEYSDQLDDYLEQFGQIRNMGSMDQILGMMPGVKPGALKDAQLDEKAIDHQEAIIRSMTRAERENPDIITASRKKRIAAGSGTSVEDVNRLLKSFDQIKKLMKQFSDPKKMRGFGKGKMKIPF